jgi:pulcherriminic acid synthase
MTAQQEVTRLDSGGKPVEATEATEIRVGRNGVPIIVRAQRALGTGYRTYEVFQRQRVQESTEKLKPQQLISADFLADPYPTLEILRENYPCYRDWLGNSFWISRYDDVTSVFVDDPNYETRSKRWFYGREDLGRDLWEHLSVLTLHEKVWDASAATIAERIASEINARGSGDLATEFAARLPLELLATLLGLPADDFPLFVERYLRLQRGAGWDPLLREAGLQAYSELCTYFTPLLSARRAAPGEDLLSVLANLEFDSGAVTAGDVVVTLLERDHETLHGGLANLWRLLLTHPDQLDHVRNDRRMLRFAWLETLRHSTPVLFARRFARHEVERFGRLLPEGALVICAAAAGNRDPRVYKDPDQFQIARKDLCQREPRGQYRADGLPAGIAVGLGKPSRFPAVPEDRPRSLYAITLSAAVSASNALLDVMPDIRMAPGAVAITRSLHIGEMHACWKLPVASH